MKTKNNDGGNKGSKPSVSYQPENTSNAEQSPAGLHEESDEESIGFKPSNVDTRKEVSPKGIEEPGQPEKEGDDEDLPSKEKERRPYIGDNPDETKKEAPKM